MCSWATLGAAATFAGTAIGHGAEIWHCAVDGFDSWTQMVRVQYFLNPVLGFTLLVVSGVCFVILQQLIFMAFVSNTLTKFDKWTYSFCAHWRNQRLPDTMIGPHRLWSWWTRLCLVVFFGASPTTALAGMQTLVLTFRFFEFTGGAIGTASEDINRQLGIWILRAVSIPLTTLFGFVLTMFGVAAAGGKCIMAIGGLCDMARLPREDDGISELGQ